MVSSRFSYDKCRSYLFTPAPPLTEPDASSRKCHVQSILLSYVCLSCYLYTFWHPRSSWCPIEVEPHSPGWVKPCLLFWHPARIPVDTCGQNEGAIIPPVLFQNPGRNQGEMKDWKPLSHSSFQLAEGLLGVLIVVGSRCTAGMDIRYGRVKNV